MIEEDTDNGGTSDELVKNVTWSNEKYDEDITGYFYDSTWEAHVFKSKFNLKHKVAKSFSSFLLFHLIFSVILSGSKLK